jgi:2-keto-4-pentenoate hydratase/2-oxohepta-3-ene-1,7-dioic acid hydratase in catechol pathway
MGVNFRSHVSAASAAVGGENPVATADAARPPAGFFVIPGTVIGPDDEIVPPPDAQKLDYEAEVAVVLPQAAAISPPRTCGCGATPRSTT